MNFQGAMKMVNTQDGTTIHFEDWARGKGCGQNRFQTKSMKC